MVCKLPVGNAAGDDDDDDDGGDGILAKTEQLLCPYMLYEPAARLPASLTACTVICTQHMDYHVPFFTPICSAPPDLCQHAKLCWVPGTPGNWHCRLPKVMLDLAWEMLVQQLG